MRRAGLVLVAALALAGCGGGGDSKSARKPNGYSHPTRIDNRYFPLRPGTEFVYEGRTQGGRKRVEHRVVFVVTGLTKVIDGVPTVVVWDRDLTKGRLVEGELAFFAQDDSGRVMSQGEYPEEWKGRRLTGAPSTWIPGLDGARAGVMMQADTRPRRASYSQGLAPKIDFADRARIRSVTARTCVPTGCYRNVLVTEERSPDEPKARQIKYYAPGVGNVRIGFEGEGQNESLVLIKVSHLGRGALARVSEQALALDRRGYSVSRKLYGRTPRAVRGSAG
jgi:hypothetical protein